LCAVEARGHAPARAADQLGADPFAAHRDAGAALLAAFSQPGVLERIFPAPIGSVPGLVMLHVRITEELVHGWDLAQATAQPAFLGRSLGGDAETAAIPPG
jgi:uncharacterized protein (TIGR03086 family)